MRNKELFDAWDSLTPSPKDKERMLRSIRLRAEETSARPRLIPRRVLALALTIVAVLGVSAFALNESGLIGWFGKKVSDDMPELAVTETDLETIQSRAQKAREIIANTPEGEVWVAEIWEKTQIFSSLAKQFTDPSEMAALIRESGTGLMFPEAIPEGYAFQSGNLGYYLSENIKDNGIQFLGEEEVEEGIRLKKFLVTGGYHRDIESMNLVFADALGNQLRLTGYLDAGSAQYAFNTSAEGAHEPVAVNGMTEALYIHNPDDLSQNAHHLHFRKTGLPQIAAYSWYELEIPGGLQQPEARPEHYDSIVCHLKSNVLDKNALIEIADSLK